MPKSSLRKSLAWVAAATASALLVPAIAMQFTSEVAWGPLDFLAAGTLLLGAGAAAVAVAHTIRRPVPRAAVITGVVVVAAAVWAELAVGILS